MRGRAAKKGIILGTTIVLLLIMVSLSVLVVSLASISSRSVMNTINDVENSMAFSCVCERLISMICGAELPPDTQIAETMSAYVKGIDDDYVFEMNHAYVDYNGKHIFNITIYSDETKSIVAFGSTVERYIDTRDQLVCRISQRMDTSFDVALSDELMNLISELFRRDMFGAQEMCAKYYKDYDSALENPNIEDKVFYTKTSTISQFDANMHLSLKNAGYDYTGGNSASATQYFNSDTNAPAFNTLIELDPEHTEKFFVLSVFFTTSDRLAMKITFSLDSLTPVESIEKYIATGHFTEIRKINGENVTVRESTAPEETTETTETAETTDPVETTATTSDGE